MPDSSSDFSSEKVGNWVGDFCHSDALGLFPVEIAESAQAVLETLLHESCLARGNALDALDDPDVKHGLLNGVARLALPESTRAFVPSLCRAFLEDLQRRGRIGNGLDLGRYVGALKQAYLEAASSKGTPYERPGAKIGRNDPCPCGSGKKYKKCCGGKEA